MAEMMRAVVKTAPKPGLSLTEVPIPAVGPSDVLIRIQAASICGTDRQLFDWSGWARRRVRHLPFVQGHELCGEVVEVGARVRTPKVGDFVSAESHVVDYEGDYFRQGLAHVAPETQIIGVDRDGAFAEYISLPWQNARPNPPDMPLKVAVLKENFGNAVHMAHAFDVAGRDVLMTGAGPAGLMTLLALKAMGVGRVILSDVNRYRLDFARRLGADRLVDPLREDLREVVRDLTGGAGVDASLEVSGATQAILDCLELTKAGGNMACFGLPKEPIQLDVGEIIFKGLKVHGVIGRRLWETWEQMEALLHDGLVDLTSIVTHQFRLDGFEEAFAVMSGGDCGKVMLIP